MDKFRENPRWIFSHCPQWRRISYVKTLERSQIYKTPLHLRSAKTNTEDALLFWANGSWTFHRPTTFRYSTIHFHSSTGPARPERRLVCGCFYQPRQLWSVYGGPWQPTLDLPWLQPCDPGWLTIITRPVARILCVGDWVGAPLTSGGAHHADEGDSLILPSVR